MTPIFFSNHSGFVSFKSTQISLAMNLWGHQTKDKEFDIRLTGGIPFWLCFNNVEMLPSLPNYTTKITSNPTALPLGTTLGYIYDTIKSRKINSSNNVGFLPFLKRGANIYCFTGAKEIKSITKTKEYLIVKFEGNLKKFHQGFWKVLLKSTLWMLSKWLNFKNLYNIQYLIDQTDWRLSRTLIFSKDFIYFRDRLLTNGSINLKLISFSFRTFQDYFIRNETSDFVTLASSKSEVEMHISKMPNDNIKYERQLFTSTGLAKLWIMGNSKHNIGENLEHLVLFSTKSLTKDLTKEFRNKFTIVNKLMQG